MVIPICNSATTTSGYVEGCSASVGCKPNTVSSGVQGIDIPTPRHERDVPRYKCIKCTDPDDTRFGRYISTLVLC